MIYITKCDYNRNHDFVVRSVDKVLIKFYF